MTSGVIGASPTVPRMPSVPKYFLVIFIVPLYRLFPAAKAASLEGILGACRTWGVESENRPQRGQFLPDLQAHSPAMGQKDGEKWTAAVDLQPTIPKSDRLLGTLCITLARLWQADRNGP